MSRPINLGTCQNSIKDVRKPHTIVAYSNLFPHIWNEFHGEENVIAGRAVGVERSMHNVCRKTRLSIFDFRFPRDIDMRQVARVCT